VKRNLIRLIEYEKEAWRVGRRKNFRQLLGRWSEVGELSFVIKQGTIREGKRRQQLQIKRHRQLIAGQRDQLLAQPGVFSRAFAVGLEGQFDTASVVFGDSEGARELICNGVVRVDQFLDAFHRRHASRPVLDAAFDHHHRQPG